MSGSISRRLIMVLRRCASSASKVGARRWAAPQDCNPTAAERDALPPTSPSRSTGPGGHGAGGGPRRLRERETELTLYRRLGHGGRLPPAGRGELKRTADPEGVPADPAGDAVNGRCSVPHDRTDAVGAERCAASVAGPMKRVPSPC